MYNIVLIHFNFVKTYYLAVKYKILEVQKGNISLSPHPPATHSLSLEVTFVPSFFEYPKYSVNIQAISHVHILFLRVFFLFIDLRGGRGKRDR